MYMWMLTTLFCVGILLVPLGLALVVIPHKVMTLSNSLNRWVSTKEFFEFVNKPRYQEALIYRHHRKFGATIVICSLISIYMLVFYAGIEATVGGVERLAETEFGRWLLQSLYYILIVLCAVTAVIGLVVFVRPSLLKSLEAWGNRWIGTQEFLESLDDVHDIPTNVLPGKPRLFGVFVLLGATYIIYSTGISIF